MSEVTPETIAQWMAGRLQQQRDGRLFQRETAREIARLFGEQFTYKNKNGNPGIDKRILKAFKDITGDTVVWNRWGYHWRKREPGDAATRKQA